jgi:hypothetical protein
MSHRVLKDGIPKERSMFDPISVWAVATWQHLQRALTQDDDTGSRSIQHPRREDRWAHTRSLF